MLGLIEEWAGFDACDLHRRGGLAATPGRIHRFELAAGELPRNGSPRSSHALGLAEAIALAGVEQPAPRHIIVYAVEGAAFAGGTA